MCQLYIFRAIVIGCEERLCLILLGYLSHFTFIRSEKLRGNWVNLKFSLPLTFIINFDTLLLPVGYFCMYEYYTVMHGSTNIKLCEYFMQGTFHR
jgi:hypothetical protein